MVFSTYLMNGTRKEYIIIGNRYPEFTGAYLAKLEEDSNWDLRRDNIYISYSATNYNFRNVQTELYKNPQDSRKWLNEYMDHRPY